jgi:hypothetical protein
MIELVMNNIIKWQNSHLLNLLNVNKSQVIRDLKNKLLKVFFHKNIIFYSKGIILKLVHKIYS